jgi:hypothetical protein
MGPEISIYLARHRAVYIEVTKVACTSIKAALAPLVDIDLTNGDGNPHVADFPSPPDAPASDDRLYPDLFTFAFVRNPWDRLFSCYRDKIGGEVEGFTSFDLKPGVADCLAGYDEFTGGMSFEDFVRAVASIPDDRADDHIRSQYTFLTNQAGTLGVDFVGRFENIEHDFARVAEEIGLPKDIKLPRLQSAGSPKRHQDHYSPEVQKIVANRFRKDIELFGYRFDG